MTTPGPTAKRLTVTARRVCLPLLRLARPDRYTDADPFRVLDVPVARITHMQQPWNGPLQLPWLHDGRPGPGSSLRRRWHAGSVLGGDWDLATTPFDGYHLTRVLRARFVDGNPWEEIPYIRKALRKVRDGEPAWGGRCRTEEQVRARCRYLDELHASLADVGYSPDGGTESALAFTHFLVNIARDGTIVRNNDGKHRIILAHILGIPSLPARVLVRHRGWQRVRDAARRGSDADLVARHASHPDLADLRR